MFCVVEHNGKIATVRGTHNLDGTDFRPLLWEHRESAEQYVRDCAAWYANRDDTYDGYVVECRLLR